MKIKIKQLFDEITKQKVYPLTTIKAVRDPSTKKSLAELLLVGEDVSETQDTPTKDADTLGGKYRASDIDKSMTYDEDESTEVVEDVEIVDADRLGGKYTAYDIDVIKQDINGLNSSLSEKVSGFSADTYQAVTGLAYDATNKKLGLKVGADTVIPFSNKVHIKTFRNICSLSSGNYTHSFIYLDTSDKTKLTIGSFSTGTATELHILGTINNWESSSWILLQNSSFSSPKEFDVAEYDEILIKLANWVSGNEMIVNDIVLE